MANDGAPDITQQLLQIQSMLAASASGNGAKPIPLLAALGVVNGSIDVGVGLTPKGKGLNSDSTFRPFSQRRNGPFAGLLAQINLSGSSILEDFKKSKEGAATMYANVQYSGSFPNGATVTSGLPASGGSDIVRV